MNTDRKTIYLCLAHMSDDKMEEKYVQEAFDTNWVVPLGPNVNAFEEELRKFVTSVKPERASEASNPNEELSTLNSQLSTTLNCSSLSTLNSSLKVVALSAGTAAVHLALLACGIKSGDEVCVQSFTFCASSHPITYLGAKPVFIGSEKDTWNMDPELLEKAIIDRKAKTGRYPKAIIPVALYGMPYQIDKIMAIANKYKIPVIEDAAEGLGSRFNGQVLGTFGRFGVLSFNGNKMITTSGGGALVCNGFKVSEDSNCFRIVSEVSELKPLKQHETTETKTETNNETTETTPANDAQTVMWLATQARDAYPYYQHSAIGYNYRMSNVCAGIGRGQMTVLEQHIRHHQHVCQLYSELLKDVEGITLHLAPNEDFSMLNNPTASSPVYYKKTHVIATEAQRSGATSSVSHSSSQIANPFESNYWLCTATIDPSIRIKGQERAYKEVIKTAVGGAAGVIHAVDSAVTECQPNENVEALRMFMLDKKVECRPVWKPMHCQPVYKTMGCPAYTNNVEEEIFKIGFCLPAGPCVSDDDVRYIVDCIKEAIEK